MANAYDDFNDGNISNATIMNQIQHALNGIDGLGFRPQVGSSFTVWKESTTYYYRKHQDGTGIDGGNPTTIGQAAIDLASAAGGGSVWLKAASYGAVSLTLKDGVTLIIENSAVTFTITIDTGADGFLIDLENGIFKYWVAGSLVGVLDLANPPKIIPDYLFWRKNATYYCRDNSTNDVLSDAAIHTLINSVIASNKVLGFKNGHYDYTNPLAALTPVIWNLSFIAESGYGKSANNYGVTFDAADIGSSDSLISINATDDTRSIYGFNCRGIKFIGPSSDASECIHLPNLDTGLIEKCTFLKWGTPIHVYFSDSGTTYTLAEQPGKVLVRDCEFAENYVRDIALARCTQNNIYANLFEAYGQRHQSIKLSGTNKTRIGPDNEFNKGGVSGDFNEHIMIEGNQGANYVPDGILICNNWAYREVNTYPFIRCTETVNPPDEIWSIGNVIEHGFAPVSADSTYCYVQSVDNQIKARDWMQGGLSEMDECSRDMIGTWAALATAYQNKWTPCHVLAKFNVPVGDGIKIQMHHDVAGLRDVLYETNTNDTNAQSHVVSFYLPSMMYFKMVADGATTLTGIEGVFE